MIGDGKRTMLRAGLLAGGAVSLMLSASLTPAHAAGSSAPVLLRDSLAGSDATIGLPGVHWQPYERNSTVEPSIAVDPANPLDAVASYHSGRDPNGASADLGYATTTDGGHTWVHGNLPGLTTHVDPAAPFNHASDPVVAFGPDHIVYVSSLVTVEDGSGSVSAGGLAVNVSKDGGVTWEAKPVFMHMDDPALINDVGVFDDKNWIVVDDSSAPGHHLGRVYVIWDIQLLSLYAYCDPDRAGAATQGCDQASNWTTSATDAATTYANSGFYLLRQNSIGSVPIVLQSGSLFDVFNDEGNAPVCLTSVTCNLAGFSEVVAPGAGAVVWPAPLPFAANPVQIASDDSNAVRLQRAGTNLPSAAMDPVTGRVAIAWAGGRFRSDGVNDLEVAVSTDPAGSVWSSPIRVGAPGASTTDYLDSYDPMIGWGSDGSLQVAYRQRQEAADPSQMSQVIDTYFQQSTDQGATWSAPLKVDTQATDVGYCAFSRGGCFEGDYSEIAPASNGNTYIVREEAYASYPGEPVNNSGTTFNNDNGHINQHAWVAVVGPQPTANTPETPLTAGLALAGLGAGAVALGVRRRRRVEIA